MTRLKTANSNSLKNAAGATNMTSIEQSFASSTVFLTAGATLHDKNRANDKTSSKCILSPENTVLTTTKNTKRFPRNSATSSLTNLLDGSAGAKVLFVTDEFFAEAENLLNPADPKFDPDAYCAQGKVMDGWESRRRREPGHDWCIIRLAYPGIVEQIEIDTAYFTGNHVPHISIQGANLKASSSNDDDLLVSKIPGASHRLHKGRGKRGTCATAEETRMAEKICSAIEFEWRDVLSITPLNPGYPETRLHLFPSSSLEPVTHIRVNYYPDGGVARLRLWGQVVVDYDRDICNQFLDLASAANGGRALECSNQHYGRPANLIKPTPGFNMGDGWETARHPNRPAVLIRNSQTGLVDTSLTDWCVFRLGAVTKCVERIVLDTRHFRGNFPESASIEGIYSPHAADEFVCSDGQGRQQIQVCWFPLLPRTRLGPDAEHVFDLKRGEIVNGHRSVSHVKVSIYPDGGISRVRIFGRADQHMDQPSAETALRSHL